MTPSSRDLCSAAAACCVAALCGAPASAQQPQEGTELREVRIHTRDVFDDEEIDGNLIYWVANALHATTKSEVVRRELFFEPGDVITAEQVAELERNLRRLGLFGEVEAELVDVGEGRSDLEVATRDRFSLLLSLGFSAFGGTTSVNGFVGERNLFGTGKALSIFGREDEDDHAYTVRYDDPQLFGSWHQLSVSLGTTDEGPDLQFGLFRPFRHLQDPWSYGVSGVYGQRVVDFYVGGESAATVPEERHDLRVFVARAHGPRDLRSRVGVDLGFEEVDFDPVRGDRPDLVEVPGDFEEFQVGASWGVDWNAAFRVERGIDAIDYDEDIRLGASSTLRAALAWRDQDGAGTALQPILAVGGRAAAEVVPATFTTLELEAGVRFDDGASVAWRTRGALHVFHTALPAQTLAASVRWDRAVDDQGLPPQLTLGEDNGLRGYPARQFASDRVVVVNLEDRIDTGLELWSVHLGMVAFADIGWIPDDAQGLSMSDPLRSVGVGLRLGSSELFGGGVFRLDFALPLDDVDGEDFGVSISATNGQVFTFFGNDQGLVNEFDRAFR